MGWRGSSPRRCAVTLARSGQSGGGESPKFTPGLAPAARLPLHLCHGEQRLAHLRPRPGREADRAGGLHGHGAQPQPRHLPGDPLRQEEADGG